MAGVPRVLIAHDDELVREILALACIKDGVDVIGGAVTYGELLDAADALSPDVLVVADHLDGCPVEDVLEELLTVDVPVIVLSADPSPERLGSLLAQDVHGYLSHDASPSEVVAGILAVARGEVVVNPAVLSTILHQWRRLRSQPISLGARRRPALTPRELDILTAMTDGLGAKAIAARLGMAIKTVENHKIRIFDKLGVRSHAHAVTVALTHGLARPKRCP